MAKTRNKIEQLIDEMCPEGVEFRALGEVVRIKHGKDYKKLNKGRIPVYGSGGVMTHVDTFSYNKPTVLIPRKGTITNLFYLDEPFWNVDTIYYTEINTTQITAKYFYYFMKTIDLSSLDTGSGRPSLTMQILYKIKIPIPPLAIQKEIVKILDHFTALEAELAAELEARKKQYEHYREELLSFDDGVEFRAFGSIAKIVRGGSPRPITSFITSEESGINWIKIGDVEKGGKYITKTAQKIKPEGITKSRFVKKGDFVLSNSMSFGRPYILKINGCIHDGWLSIEDYRVLTKMNIKSYIYSDSKS